MPLQDIMRERERATVNPSYGTLSSSTMGRRKPLKGDIRTEFSRDRDRIMYSASFYRLGGKTQVFMSPQNPLISNRMTHTLQVAQIARTIARVIGLNEDLVEAIAMGHDVGHPPFGHRGEVVLDNLSKRFQGIRFEHHAQSLHMLENVERGGKGLNLTYEVKDGIITHSGEDRGGIVSPAKGPYDWDQAVGMGLSVKREPYTLEGCVVKLCDKIAYVGKDIEDAVQAGIITRDDIPERCAKRLGRTNGEIIDTIVKDIVRNFRQDLEAFRKEHGRDPARNEISVRMSEDIAHLLDTLIFEFNYQNIYLSDVNLRYSKQTEGIIEEIFMNYMREFMGLKKRTKEFRLSLWDLGLLGEDKGKNPGSPQSGGDVFNLTIGEIETALARFQPGRWTPWEEGAEVGLERLIDLRTEVGAEQAIDALKDLRLDIVRDNERSFSGGTSSILYFLKSMNDEYVRNTPATVIIRDAIVSMTDDMALATFSAMRIPRPIV